MTNRTTPDREADGRLVLLATAPCGSGRDAPKASAAACPARVDLPAVSSSRGSLGGAATASDRAATAAAGGPARPASPLLRAPPARPPGKAYRTRGDFGVWGTPKLDERGRPPPGMRLPARPWPAPAPGRNDRMRALAGFLAAHQRRPCRAKPPPRRLRRMPGRGPRRQGPRRPRPARRAGRVALPQDDAQGRGVPPCAPSRPRLPLNARLPLARQARRRRGERNGGPGRFR